MGTGTYYVRTRPAWLATILVLAICFVAMPQAAQAMHAFDARCLEIDNWAQGADVLTQAGALNDNPACGDTFIDWAGFAGALAAHTISDGVGNADPDIVGPQDKLVGGSSLPKEDIYKLYVSNNFQYFYMAMCRRSNNGNSQWHWFITKISPTATPGQPIIFHLQNGDMEFRVCFPKGSAPQDFSAQVFQVSGLSPGQVVNVRASDIWSTVTLSPSPGALAASSLNLVNTTALPGALDDHGNPTNIYETAEFAEGAIDLGALGIAPCGATAYITVLTRSSCSLTSDLKDISGPTPYEFGQVTVTAGTPTIACTGASGAEVTLTANATGWSGTYAWTWPAGFTHVESLDTATSTGTGTVSAGLQQQICVTASAVGIPGCSDQDCVTVDIPQQLLVSIGAPVIECTTGSGAQVTLTASASGGTSPYSYAWSEGGSPLGSGNPLVHAFSPGSHTVRVDVTDSAGCTAFATKTFTVLAPVSVTLEVTGDLDCVSSVQLKATAAGGDGNYTYTWYVDGNQVAVDPQPGGGPSFYTLVFPDDQYCGTKVVSVSVVDSRNCANPTPNPSLTIGKTTVLALQ